MANIFILDPSDQPTGKTRLINELKDCLESKEYESFRIIVAFAKQGPLLRLEKNLKDWLSQGKPLEAIYGIDAKGTSIEALEFSLNNFSEVRIAHATPSAYSSTFHPKIYLFSGANKSKVFIGSNNLTVGGLESNFESYVCIDLTNNEDSELLNRLEAIWNDTKALSKKLDDDFLDTLKKSGILPTEKAINQRGANEKRLFIERQTVNKKEFNFPYLAVVPPSKLPTQTAKSENEKNVEYLIFRFLTAADFFNMYKPAGTEERGGGQAYIDIPVESVSLDQWRKFFDKSSLVVESTKTNGPSWDVTVNSIGQDENQNLTIYQRRRQSVCIASQRITSTRENRVNAWRPENGFPEPLDPTVRNSVPDKLMVFIAKTTEGKYWAGWTINKNYHESSNKLLKQLAHPDKDGHSGFIEAKGNIQIIIDNIEDPLT